MFRNSWLMSVVVAALVFVIVVSPVDAGRHWCRSDPTFSIAGTTTSVHVAVYQDLQVHVTGPIAVTLSVPPGTAVEVMYVDEGFNKFGDAISIVSDPRLKVLRQGIQVRFQVAVPAARIMPFLVTVAPTSGRALSVTGNTKTTMIVNMLVAPAS
jgi:hypothetical protein